MLILAIKGIGASLINTVMFGLEADTVECGVRKTGRRSDGATRQKPANWTPSRHTTRGRRT
jgi:hypothetical protein